MEMTHVVLELADLVRLDTRSGGAVVASLVAGDVVVALGARDRSLGPLGPWLTVGPDYPASMAARDVATLAWLGDFEHVVIAGERASEQAAVVRAMLTDDEINLESDVLTLRGAYNRPAPPRPITVWYSLDGHLGDGTTVLDGAPVDAPDATRYFRD
ncbi:MAG: hypothetical protein KGJ92_02980 [Actinomycetales bacterium]|nr:hypothetical protein [Actinomycetales bacterium]